jgi:hypothetical protein
MRPNLSLHTSQRFQHGCLYSASLLLTFYRLQRPKAGQCLRHHRRNSGRFSVELAAQKERAEHVREIVSYLVIYHELLSAFLV